MMFLQIWHDREPQKSQHTGFTYDFSCLSPNMLPNIGVLTWLKELLYVLVTAKLCLVHFESAPVAMAISPPRFARFAKEKECD